MEEVITALLASVAGGRRYWMRAPQNTNAEAGPYIVLHRIDGVPRYHMEGGDGLVASRIQANCFARTYTAAKAASRALVATLDGYSGGTIQAIFIENEGRDLAATDAGEVNNLFAIAVDFIVHHET